MAGLWVRLEEKRGTGDLEEQGEQVGTGLEHTRTCVRTRVGPGWAPGLKNPPPGFGPGGGRGGGTGSQATAT